MGLGRPTDYREEYVIQVEKLCKLGATDEEIADFFEISVATLNNWKREHPDFLASVKNGKILADANVANSLYQRAIGYEHDDEEIKVVSDGQGMGSSIQRVPIRKHYPPDPVSMIFWLKNRQKKLWRDKIETGFTDGEGNDAPIQVIQLPHNGRNNTTPPEDNSSAAGLSDESIK